MKRFWVIVSICTLALLYSSRSEYGLQHTVTHDFTLESITTQDQQQQQSNVIREYLFPQLLGEVQSGHSDFLRIPTRINSTNTLLHNQLLKRIKTVQPVYDKPIWTTVNAFKVIPYPKHYFIFFLSSLNC